MIVYGSGRLTSDPEQRTVAKDTTITNFSVACRRAYKKDGQPETDYFDIVAFGKLAETIAKYCKKGQQIFITGRLENNNYENKKGDKVYKQRIILESFEFGAAPKGSENTEKASAPSDEPAPVESKSDDSMMGFMEDDEELPFN